MEEVKTLYKIAISSYKKRHYNNSDKCNNNLINLAIANDLEYELLNYFPDLSIKLRRQRERRKFETKRLIETLNRLSKEEKIKFITMKTYYNYDFYDDDIDCIINCSFKEFGSLAKKYDLDIKNFNIREPRKINYNHPQNEEVYLHLHQWVSWNSIRFLRFKTIYDRSVEINLGSTKVRIPSLEHQILICFLHSFFENNRLKLGELLNISLLIKDNVINWKYIRNYAKNNGLLKPYLFFLKILNQVKQILNDQKLDMLDLPSFPIYYPVNLTIGGRLGKFKQDFKKKRFINILENFYAFTLDFVVYPKNRFGVQTS